MPMAGGMLGVVFVLTTAALGGTRKGLEGLGSIYSDDLRSTPV